MFCIVVNFEMVVVDWYNWITIAMTLSSICISLHVKIEQEHETNKLRYGGQYFSLCSRRVGKKNGTSTCCRKLRKVSAEARHNRNVWSGC